MSPSTAQPSRKQGLTEAIPSTGKSKNEEHVSGMFSELQNDADFMLIAEKWNTLPKDLKEAIAKMMK